MRKIIKLAGLIGVVLGLAFAGTAWAHTWNYSGPEAPGTSVAEPPHEDTPTPLYATNPSSKCVVQGQVKVPPPPALQGGVSVHGEYDFVSTTLQCVDIATTVITTYKVDAFGAADGPCQPDPNEPNYVDGNIPKKCATDPLKHGSSTAVSWSHGGQYVRQCGAGESTDNKGNITATEVDANGNQVPGTTPSRGWVKFDRVGPATVAWGHFCTGDLSTSAATDDFSADLVFTPTASNTDYNLDGVACIY